MNNREKFLAALPGEDRETLAKVFDKAAVAERRGIGVFTSFLSEREYSLVKERSRHIDSVTITAFGGFDGAGRLMLRFSDGEENFPIKAVEIRGRGIEKLSHPDILGSLMSLGIERSCMGDIVKDKDRWIVFVEDAIAQYVADSLFQAGGVHTECAIAEIEDVAFEQSFEEITGTVASLRADSVVSVMLKSSRSKAAEYIEGQMFFLNQVLCTKCDKEIKENDILTVRHKGKAKVCDVSGRSKKGRIFITLLKYM